MGSSTVAKEHNNLKLAVVVWNDAWVRAENPIDLEDARAAHKPEPVTTVGWVLLDNEVGIQLANEYYEQTYRGRTFIPRAMVLSCTYHKLVKPRKVEAERLTGV
jgi:hypothetical protein